MRRKTRAADRMLAREDGYEYSTARNIEGQSSVTKALQDGDEPSAQKPAMYLRYDCWCHERCGFKREVSGSDLLELCPRCGADLVYQLPKDSSRVFPISRMRDCITIHEILYRLHRVEFNLVQAFNMWQDYSRDRGYEWVEVTEQGAEAAFKRWKSR